ncbi:MAG: EAL domain-containing protein [Rubrivivax sp.]|nr:EAL domain-containing protein [Rubrivivax sp.]
MPSSPTRTASWRWPLAWAATVLLAVLGVLASMHQSSRSQLQHDAEHLALHHAELVIEATPDLQDLLAGQARPAALASLRQLRRVGDVFRFKLFRSDGVQLLVSDDLDRPDAEVLRPARRASLPHEVLRGEPLVELHESDGRGDRPLHYSQAFVPVKTEGRVLGAVEVHVDQTERHASVQAALWQNTLAVALGLSALAGLGLAQLRSRQRAERRAEDRVHYLARHDALSGALNRSSFGEALAQAVQRRGLGGGDFAVLCLDLDHFKDVNDSLGHAAGDEVLRQATQRLRDVLRNGDTVARLGGDEFAVLQQGVEGAEAVRRTAQRILDALSKPYRVGGQHAGQTSVSCGVSVGAAIFGADAGSLEELLHKADLALYRAKAAGRGGFSFYDAQLDRELQDRRELVRDLRQAVQEDRLHLHYQPQYGGDGHTLTGYEALLRWTHPTRGELPPAQFIPLAEENGLIDTIGAWVLRRACVEAAHWPAPLSVSINLSPAQFRGEQLVHHVTRALAQSGLAPQRLELEITETLLMRNTEQVVRMLRTLSALGVRIAMDDFGTGCSSLAYLWRFPFDKLKIDKAFTQALADDPKVNLIVRAVISLAHSLEIRVNAEGVETPGQLRMLQKHGCDEFQGYLLGHPVAPATLQHNAATTQAPARPGPSDHTLAHLPTMPATLADTLQID